MGGGVVEKHPNVHLLVPLMRPVVCQSTSWKYSPSCHTTANGPATVSEVPPAAELRTSHALACSYRPRTPPDDVIIMYDDVIIMFDDVSLCKGYVINYIFPNYES